MGRDYVCSACGTKYSWEHPEKECKEAMGDALDLLRERVASLEEAVNALRGQMAQLAPKPSPTDT
jgi:hypothetical protein